MELPAMLKHTAEWWSAVAGVSSAIATLGSLYGARAAYVQARRSADAATAAVRNQRRPILTPHIESWDPAASTIGLAVRNTGQGIANLPSLARTTKEEFEGWYNGGRQQRRQLRRSENLHSGWDLNMILPGQSEVFPAAVERANEYEIGDFVLNYSDDADNEFQCVFSIFIADEDHEPRIYVHQYNEKYS